MDRTGDASYRFLGLPKIPVLFGFVIMLKKPVLIPGAILYVLLIYFLPIGVIARLCASSANRLAAKLLSFPPWFSVAVHLGLLYATLHMWSGMSAYRVITLKLTLIAVMVTLSLNVINGYMGEFSCSHPGFMALGAYGASVFTVVLFVVPDDASTWHWPVGFLKASRGRILLGPPNRNAPSLVARPPWRRPAAQICCYT